MTGSAALFYLTNTEYRSDQSVRLRREVIQVVLNGMEQYQEVTVSLLCGLIPISDKLNLKFIYESKIFLFKKVGFFHDDI